MVVFWAGCWFCQGRFRVQGFGFPAQEKPKHNQAAPKPKLNPQTPSQTQTLKPTNPKLQPGPLKPTNTNFKNLQTPKLKSTPDITPKPLNQDTNYNPSLNKDQQTSAIAPSTRSPQQNQHRDQNTTIEPSSTRTQTKAQTHTSSQAQTLRSYLVPEQNQMNIKLS